MDLEELRAFLAIVETGSFLGAATELGLSRGTLRRRVDALEARIGAPLVERSPKGVVLTEAGALLAKQGRRLVQSSSALLSAVREVAREPAGELRISVPIGLPPHAIVELFGVMREALPQVSLHLQVAREPAAGRLDDADLVVHFGDHSPPGWVAHELVRAPVRALAHVDYLARAGVPERPAALAEHTLLTWIGPGFDGLSWPLRDGSRVEVGSALVSNDVYLIRRMVIAGLGIGLLPDAPLPDPDAAPGTLVPVLDGIVGRELALRIAIPAVLTGSPKIAQLVAAARRFFSD